MEASVDCDLFYHLFFIFFQMLVHLDCLRYNFFNNYITKLARVLVVDHVLQEVLLDVPPVLERFNEKPFKSTL